jgi:4-amino-4-deoxychorismate lyase
MTTPNILFNINGQPQPVGDLTISLLDDRGLAYGHGLFESMVLTDSTIPLLDRHLSRLIQDSQLMGISVGNDDINHYLKVFLETLSAQAFNSGIVKIILTAGSGGRGYAMPAKIVPTLIYSYTPLPENVAHQRDKGVDIRLCRHLLGTGSTLAGVKHLNRLDQVMARSEWSHNRYQDGLMFTEAGDVIEATSANIFVKTQDGQWLTPDLDQSGVSGVMRKLLIEEVFPACDIRVSVKAINRDTLLDAQQILLCNSVRGILRVNSVYGNDDQLLMTLPLDQQSLMLSETLIKLYPQYQ